MVFEWRGKCRIRVCLRVHNRLFFVSRIEAPLPRPIIFPPAVVPPGNSPSSSGEPTRAAPRPARRLSNHGPIVASDLHSLPPSPLPSLPFPSSRFSSSPPSPSAPRGKNPPSNHAAILERGDLEQDGFPIHPSSADNSSSPQLNTKRINAILSFFLFTVGIIIGQRLASTEL